MATQQADSLVGMLGWYPLWLRKGDPNNVKWMARPDGKMVPALMDCYRQRERPVGGCGRGFDIFEGNAPLTFSPIPDKVSENHAAPIDTVRKPPFIHDVPPRGFKPFIHPHTISGKRRWHRNGKPRALHEEDSTSGGDGLQHGGEISVHMRMFPTADGDNWLARMVADFNGTRPSDVYVINFGAHYRDSQEGFVAFQEGVSTLLNDMGKLGEDTTMVWREIAPTHFPVVNATFDGFEALANDAKKNACCSGTPPAVDPRNVWVETYLAEKGLSDEVRILRIRAMFRFRGPAHHTCYAAAPTEPSRPGIPYLAMDEMCPSRGVPTDCRHWSEPGVVEEWNRLMVNHLCPA